MRSNDPARSSHTPADPRPPALTPRTERDLSWGLAALSLVAAALVAGLILEGVLDEEDLAAYDPAITSAAVEGRSPALTAVAQFFTFLGSTIGIGTMAAALLGWVWFRRRNPRLVGLLAGAMALALALTIVMKELVGRMRPPTEIVTGDPLASFAFPSGHTLNSTVFFGLVALLLMARTQSILRQSLIVLAWFTLSVSVALSRVYLGFHWMTDMLGGSAIGVAVLAATILTAHFLRDPRLVAEVSPFRDDVRRRRRATETPAG